MDMHYPYQLPPLPYAYEALSPNISGDTLHFHHDKHFQTYVDNLNTALADCPECQSKPLDELLKNLDRLPDPKRTAIRNNGGRGIQPSALLRRHVRLSQLPPLRRAGHGHGAGLRLF